MWLPMVSFIEDEESSGGSAEGRWCLLLSWKANLSKKKKKRKKGCFNASLRQPVWVCESLHVTSVYALECLVDCVFLVQLWCLGATVWSQRGGRGQAAQPGNKAASLIPADRRLAAGSLQQRCLSLSYQFPATKCFANSWNPFLHGFPWFSLLRFFCRLLSQPRKSCHVRVTKLYGSLPRCSTPSPWAFRMKMSRDTKGKKSQTWQQTPGRG